MGSASSHVILKKNLLYINFGIGIFLSAEGVNSRTEEVRIEKRQPLDVINLFMSK
jgi:hypothetical protein